MLVFVDQPKTIKVMRLVEEGGSVRRVRIGVVQKSKPDVSEELSKSLDEDEQVEVRKVISLYAAKDDAQLRLDIARFPEILRQVVEYMCKPDIPETERRVLATALTEGSRQLRRIELDSREHDA